MKTSYRLLIELDSDLWQIESVAVYNVRTERIEAWFGNAVKAKEYILENGEFATGADTSN